MWGIKRGGSEEEDRPHTAHSTQHNTINLIHPSIINQIISHPIHLIQYSPRTSSSRKRKTSFRRKHKGGEMSNSSTGFTRTTTTTTDQSSLTSEAAAGAAVVSSNSPSSPSDHNLFFHPSNSEQLCYVHCSFCDTVLAVSVPCSSLFKTVTVRCGHCSNLLSVNMRALLLPPPAPVAPASPPFFSSPNNHNLLDEIRNSSPNLMMNHHHHHQTVNNHHEQMLPVPGVDYRDLPKPPVVNRPPEKRQRVPSAYNRFIKEEIQRIKAGNPDISHREAFSAAAKNWAHFPHIHFGLMPDHQPVKKVNMRQQDGEDHVLMKDGFLSPSNNIGVSPY